MCEGSGWKVVERSAEGAQPLASAEAARPGAAAGEPKMVWAVPCDCTAGNQAERVLAQARVPERYRHCDFENFETDNEIEHASREQLAAWNRSLAQAKLVVAAFRGGISRRRRARPAADGALRRREDASRRRGAEGNRAARAQRAFLRLPRAAEGNSGQLQRREPGDGDGRPRAGAEGGNSGARRRRVEQAVALGARNRRARSEHALQREARHDPHHEFPRCGCCQSAPAAARRAWPGCARQPSRIRSPTASASASARAFTRCAAPSKFPPPITARKSATSAVFARSSSPGSALFAQVWRYEAGRNGSPMRFASCRLRSVESHLKFSDPRGLTERNPMAREAIPRNGGVEGSDGNVRASRLR